jgi:hypothetical protein
VKVALIGTHGVGKTTLCFCPLPINRETSAAAQGWILHTQMAWELEAEAGHPLVICDRSVLDNYCYLVHATGPQPNWEPLVAHWLPTYDVLVKVPLWTTPRWDGVRDTDLAFQRDIDALLDQQLAQRGLDALRLQVEERERWGEVVMAKLVPLVCPQPSLFPEEQ